MRTHPHRPKSSRFSVAAVALLGGLICAISAVADSPPALGDILPTTALELERLDVNGGPTTLQAQRGEGGLLVIFSANTCAYVTDWLDRFPLYARQAQEEKLGFVIVNSNARKRRTDDSEEAMRLLAEEHFPSVPYLLDEGSELADLLGATRTPEVFLFDADLKLVYQGLIDDHSGPLAKVERHYLRDALVGLESGIFPPPTAPIGCSVLRPRRRNQKASGSGQP